MHNLIGFGRLKIFDEDLAWLEGGSVKSSYQKQGIGKELMGYAINSVRQKWFQS